MAFRVGQRVCCIDNSMKVAGAKRWPGITYPELGPVYHIREVRDLIDKCALLLVEIRNPPDDTWGVELGFDALRFRPVVSTDTGMAVLEQIRRDVTNKELRPIFEDEQV